MARFLSMIAVLVAVCVLCSGNAWAAKGGKGGGLSAYNFEQLDKDQDGKLSINEFKGMFKDADQASKMFQKADKNGDKYVSKDEFKALEEGLKEHAKNRKKK